MAQNKSNLQISRSNSKALSSDSKAVRLTTRNIIENGEELFHSIRWKFGIVFCPHCGSLRICFLKSNQQNASKSELFLAHLQKIPAIFQKQLAKCQQNFLFTIKMSKPHYHYRCMDCKSDFTDKTNTLMHNSKLPVSIWLQTV